MRGQYAQDWIDAKRAARMDSIDAMAPELRALVHEYGLNVVKAFLDLGVAKPKHIRHLINTTLSELSPTVGGSSAQGHRPWRTDTNRALEAGA